MSENLSILLGRYREAIVKILGEHLNKIILYGSYARGDFRQDSDMDIMILADVQPGEISGYADKVYDVTYDFETRYGMEINPLFRVYRFMSNGKMSLLFYEYRKRWGSGMIQEFYGKDLAAYKLERAKEELDTAELLYYNEKLKAANNRAYYSIYYSVTAVLCLEAIAFKRHKDTIGYFNKNYVHTGKFPGEVGRKIAKAAKVRHASDYDEFYITSKEEATRQIQTAKELIDLTEKFISGYVCPTRDIDNEWQ